MKVTISRLVVVLLVLVIGLSSAAWFVFARDKGKELGFTILRESNRAILAELDIAGEFRADVTVGDRSMVTARRIGEAQFYAFSPALPEDSPGVRWLRLTSTNGRVDVIDRERPLLAAIRDSQSLSDSGIELTVTGVQRGTLPFLVQPIAPGYKDDPMRMKVPEDAFTTTGNGTCCVTCREWSVCSASVKTPCGSCTFSTYVELTRNE